MSNCWSEGDLRASLDGELEAASAERLTAHLTECAACEATRQALANRAARVSRMVSALEVEASILPIRPILPMPPIPAQRVWRNTVALGTLAAGLAIIALTLPHGPASKVIQDANLARPNPATSLTTHVVPAQPVSHTHPRHAKPEQRAAVPTPVAAPATVAPAETDNGYFLALDDEPIETGIVMRVASPSGDFQADVIVGPDGRAHAIRILNDGNGN